MAPPPCDGTVVLVSQGDDVGDVRVDRGDENPGDRARNSHARSKPGQDTSSDPLSALFDDTDDNGAADLTEDLAGELTDEELLGGAPRKRTPGALDDLFEDDALSSGGDDDLDDELTAGAITPRNRLGVGAPSDDQALIAAPPSGFEDPEALSLEDLLEEGEEAAEAWEEELDDDRVDEFVRYAAKGPAMSGTAFSAFQRRMAQYPQLPPERQSELVALYQAGISAKKAVANGNAKKRDFEAARQAESAIEQLAGSGFRLMLLIVRELAESRHGRERSAEMLPDLMGEANEALLEAARDFDPGRGLSFSTYLARVVRDRVRMSLTKDGPIRLSSSWSRIKRIASVRTAVLTEQLGRAPSIAEVQQDLLDRCFDWAETRLTPDQMALPDEQRKELMLAKLRKQGMLGAIRDLEEVLATTQVVASLDIEIGDEGGSTLGDLLGAPDSDELFDRVELGELRGAINQALSTLSDRERAIILHRFGFVDGEMWTYSKIAQMFGVTSERIRQIERAALARLNSPHGQYHYLSGFLPSQFEGDD